MEAVSGGWVLFFLLVSGSWRGKQAGSSKGLFF